MTIVKSNTRINEAKIPLPSSFVYTKSRLILSHLTKSVMTTTATIVDRTNNITQNAITLVQPFHQERNLFAQFGYLLVSYGRKKH